MADHVELVDVESDVETVAVVPEADERARTAVVAAAAPSAMVLPSPRKAATLRAAAATRDRAAA